MNSELIFRTARLSDIDALVALEEDVEKNLPSREMFAIDGPDFYFPIIDGAGHILLAEDRTGRLAGVSVIRFPAMDDPENLGSEVGLCGDELSQVRHLESVFVHPDFQGRRLADELIRRNMDITQSAGKDIALATVWPLNAPSLRLHLRLGLRIRAFALKYGGRPRFVLMSPCGHEFSDVTELAAAEDFELQKRQLSRGMVGTGIRRRSDGGFDIEYRHPLR